MSWISPFPPDADRPWRAVGLYALNGLWERLHSWVFWLGAMSGPIMLLIVFGVSAVSTPNLVPERGLAVVARSAAVAEHARAVADGQLISVVGPQEAAALPRVLYLEGDSVADLHPRLVLTKDQGVARQLATRFVASVRAHAALTDEERARAHPQAGRSAASRRAARADPVEPTEPVERAETAAPADAPDARTAMRDVALLLRSGLHWFVAVGLMFGVLGGLSASVQLGRLRQEGFFGVLRVGTPAAVLYLGGLLEFTLSGALVWGPWALLLFPLVVVLPVLIGALAPADIGLLLVGLPAGMLLAVFVGYSVFAAIGVAMGASQRQRKGGRTAGGGARIMLWLPVLYFGPALLGLEDGALLVGSFVPVLGLALAAKALVSDASLAVCGAALLWQVGLALAATRAGAWVYGLDESPWQDLRRWWRR